MACWTDLANELLQGILDCLPNSDIKNIRLTCRLFYITTPLTLNRVFISPFKRDLDVLRPAANHPVFSLQITEIVWDDRRLYLDEARYCELAQFDDTGIYDFQSSAENPVQVDKNRYFAGGRGSLRKAMIELCGHMSHREKAHQVLRCHFDEQHSVLESGEDVETFKFTLQAFPRLRRVTIADVFPKLSTEFHRSGWLLRMAPYKPPLSSWELSPWLCSATWDDNVCYMTGPTLRGYYAAVQFHKVLRAENSWEEVLHYLRDVVGWGSDPNRRLRTLTVSLRLKFYSHQIVILRDELKHLFEWKAPNPFTTMERLNPFHHGATVIEDSVLPGFGRVVDDFE